MRTISVKRLARSFAIHTHTLGHPVTFIRIDCTLCIYNNKCVLNAKLILSQIQMPFVLKHAPLNKSFKLLNALRV